MMRTLGLAAFRALGMGGRRQGDGATGACCGATARFFVLGTAMAGNSLRPEPNRPQTRSGGAAGQGGQNKARSNRKAAAGFKPKARPFAGFRARISRLLSTAKGLSGGRSGSGGGSNATPGHGDRDRWPGRIPPAGARPGRNAGCRSPPARPRPPAAIIDCRRCRRCRRMAGVEMQLAA